MGDVFLSARQLSGAEDTPQDSQEESEAPSPNITASLSAQSVSSYQACCSGCPHHGFCSPRSYSCYHSQRKSYYADCRAQPAPSSRACWSWCPHHGFCSPESHSWCHSLEDRGWHPGDCRKSYSGGSWCQWICTAGGVTHYCSSDCSGIEDLSRWIPSRA